MKKRRAKRISDRNVNYEISEEERTFLSLVAEIIAQIVLKQLDEEQDPNTNKFQQIESSKIFTKKKPI
ncbi:hypothetical protein HDF26_000125 [Pedobacter cryoconitis]|uniref:hypothetical protein n=1 Tax=Pedobacter cryoconitis TaxID=188932 RepID=UPI001612DDF3|nr:hypothetical protein [Pedobacter cryoconitis]MBB6269698.1 hypothetical protein [Pedobacter cryoconitis]